MTAPAVVAPGSKLAPRLAVARSLPHMLTGRADDAVAEALTARAIQERTQLADEWTAALSLILLRAYTWLEDFVAMEREATAALAAPHLTEPVKRVMVPVPRALAWFEAGRLAEADDADQHQPADDRHPLRFPAHGQDPCAGHLPQARGGSG